MTFIAVLLLIWVVSGFIAGAIIKQIRRVKLVDLQGGPISLLRVWRGQA
jgi:hypothetical protein